MENKKGIGPQKKAAAILLLWGFLYAFTEIIAINSTGAGHISMNAFGYFSRLCSLGLIILLFMGKRNVWFAIIIGAQTLLSARNLIIAFSVYNFIWLAANVLMLVIAIFSQPSFSAGRKNPFENLEFIPAGLYLLPYILFFFTNSFPYGAMYYINAVISALAWWLMARALTAYGAQGSAPAMNGSQYKTYVQPAAQPQFVQTAPMNTESRDNGPGVLLVRFSIEKLNALSGSYGFQSGKLIGQAVPPSLLEGMTISDGDSAATLRGSEYVCIVSISALSGRAALKERIEPLILASEEIKAYGSYPLTQVVSSTSEPLVVDGIVTNGKIEGPGGWCASGFMSAWKE